LNPYFTSNDLAFGTTVRGAITRLKSQPWKVVFVQSAAVAQQPVTDQARTIVLIALGTSFILGVSTLLISRTITVPVSRLTSVAEQLTAGNLQARVDIRSQDELGTLADTLNSMSGQLEQTLAGLEQTIAQRTADLEQRGKELEQRTLDLEATTLRSERRAAQLLAVSTVANAIANIQNLDELLPRIAEVISQQFGFYHVGIFLNDVANTYAVLRATNSEGGQRMLARGHRLKIGEVGIVGAVAGNGRPRIALDTGDDAVFFNNPDLPATRSEMALPLRSGTRVIGVLDVQSTEPNAFSDEDIEIITILADQVSIAIRNAQLFEESQIAAKETQLLLQAYARDQWRRVTRAQRLAGYRFDGANITPIKKSPETDGVISIPVVVRGQPIGKLGIRPPKGRPLNQDEMDIVNAITERLAIAAENARLLQESQERATKEQAIGEITAKIGASINLRSILQTAVEELGQVLPGSEVTIKLDTKK
ncbi:MAG: GAF domain-containing protein, partial [Anaerolineales bacterium]